MATVDVNTVEDGVGIGILCSDYSMCDIRENSISGIRRDHESSDSMREGYGIVSHYFAHTEVRATRFPERDTRWARSRTRTLPPASSCSISVWHILPATRRGGRQLEDDPGLVTIVIPVRGAPRITYTDARRGCEGGRSLRRLRGQDARAGCSAPRPHRSPPSKSVVQRHPGGTGPPRARARWVGALAAGWPANAGRSRGSSIDISENLEREPFLVVPNRAEVDRVERVIARRPALLGGRSAPSTTSSSSSRAATAAVRLSPPRRRGRLVLRRAFPARA